MFSSVADMFSSVAQVWSGLPCIKSQRRAKIGGKESAMMTHSTSMSVSGVSSSSIYASVVALGFGEECLSYEC